MDDFYADTVSALVWEATISAVYAGRSVTFLPGVEWLQGYIQKSKAAA